MNQDIHLSEKSIMQKIRKIYLIKKKNKNKIIIINYIININLKFYNVI